MLKYGRNMICLRCDYDTNKDECIICHEMNDSDESMMMYDDKYMKCMVSVWYMIWISHHGTDIILIDCPWFNCMFYGRLW